MRDGNLTFLALAATEKQPSIASEAGAVEQEETAVTLILSDLAKNRSVVTFLLQGVEDDISDASKAMVKVVKECPAIKRAEGFLNFIEL